MNTDSEQRGSDRRDNEHSLNLDDVVSTQPELGPSIPDGGFGWVVFIATLFFQILVPCLIVNFGIFLAFSKLENGTADDKNIVLWDDRLLYVALFFSISKGFFDPFTRTLTATTTTPRLVAVIGTCLTCAGLLFMWMGMTANRDYWLFAPAGLLSGLGASILLVQCDTIVAQYFRMKLSILHQISRSAAIFGFIIAPIILGPPIMNTNLTRVLLWYQAIILQGLVISLIFKKPQYLKSKQRNKPYQFVLSNPDDEEDILSKNARELQIKRQTSSESHMSKIAIGQPEAGTSSDKREEGEGTPSDPKTWVKFGDEAEAEQEDVKYAKLHEWEVFDDDDDDDEDDKTPKKQKWERFEHDDPPSPRIVNNLSLAEETNTRQMNSVPSPLFADFPVNNNSSYAYDDEIVTDAHNTNVFAPNNSSGESIGRYLDLMKEPTFYKSLLMMVANTYSTFVFFALYPSYLYIEADFVNIRHMTELVGIMSLANLILLSIIYWINVDRKKRPIFFWVFYWVGSIGYFMIADFTQEYLLVVGGVQVIVSIGALDHFSRPLLKIPLRGGTSGENTILSIFSSLALLLFMCINPTFKTVFRLIAILHFFAGSLWLANFAYKKLRIR